jgi:hypothetical protein
VLEGYKDYDINDKKIISLPVWDFVIPHYVAPAFCVIHVPYRIPYLSGVQVCFVHGSVKTAKVRRCTSYNGNWEKGTMSSYSIQGNNLILSSSSTSSSSTKSRIFTINGTELTITETELDGNEKEEETKRYRKM